MQFGVKVPQGLLKNFCQCAFPCAWDLVQMGVQMTSAGERIRGMFLDFAILSLLRIVGAGVSTQKHSSYV